MNLGLTRSGYRGATIEDAGAHNTRMVLRAIRAQGTLTKAELARQTGLAHPTVTNITRRLMERGLLRTAGMQRGGRGQPATRLVINAEGAHAIGLNVDRDHITMVLADFAGTVKARLDSEVAFALPEQVRSFYRRNLDKLLAIAGVEAEAITGIGLALPDGLGEVDLPGMPGDYAQWSATNLEALFAEPLGKPIFIENDAAAAAIGEMQFGRGQREQSFFYVLISYGLGGGLVVGGHYDRGADGRSGEIGFMPVMGEGGAPVPLQSIVSIAGLNRRLAQAGRAAFAQGEASGADAALQRVLDDWIEECARALVQPLVAVNLLINPGVVLVGGRLPMPLLERLTQRTNLLLRSGGRDAPAIAPVMPAALAEDASAVGAALLSFDDLALAD
ncbi:ROK family transcriptional regulator [Novosphingobium sp. NDB2Meth1]|uniref:ROK family transcriptional regulator n=1 Tax=Novosphingobium sp. NDB2Meth1 TaxID=1892847 RepID=UPI00093155CE|nr:ROK family transcriptional regulator [Novosphingobium sp. NDB2Meth1]